MLIDVLIHNFYRTRDIFLFGQTKVKRTSLCTKTCHLTVQKGIEKVRRRLSIELTWKSVTRSLPNVPMGESRDMEVTVDRKLLDSVRFGMGDRSSVLSLSPSPMWSSFSIKMCSSVRKAFMRVLMVSRT